MPVRVPTGADRSGAAVGLITGRDQQCGDDHRRPARAASPSAQVEQALLNVATGLGDVGTTFDDVAKLTVYVVDRKPDKIAALGEGVARAGKQLDADLRRPITLLGVSALGEPDILVEVDAVAVLP